MSILSTRHAAGKYANVGIYAIQCGERRYVGLSCDLAARRKQHLTSLHKGTHYNKKLQAAFNLFGGNFIIIATCNFDDLSRLEKTIIARDAAYGFSLNLRAGGSVGGKMLTDETRRKISANTKAQMSTFGARARISALKSKRVVCLDTGEEFVSATVLGKVLGVKDPDDSIRRGNHIKGLKYAYVGEPIPQFKTRCKSRRVVDIQTKIEYVSVTAAGECLGLTRYKTEKLVREGTLICLC